MKNKKAIQKKEEPEASNSETPAGREQQRSNAKNNKSHDQRKNNS